MLPLRQIIRGLRPMIRPVRGRILLSVLIGLVRIAASLGFVWICKRLVDIATGELDAPLPLNIGILLGIVTTAAASSIKQARVRKAEACCTVVEQGLAAYYLTEVVTMLFTLVALWIVRRLDGMFEYQRDYLRRVRQESLSEEEGGSV